MISPEQVPVRMMQEALESALEFAGLPRYSREKEEGYLHTIRIRIMRGVVEAAVKGVRDPMQLRAAALRYSIHCCFVNGHPITPS